MIMIDPKEVSSHAATALERMDENQYNSDQPGSSFGVADYQGQDAVPPFLADPGQSQQPVPVPPGNTASSAFGAGTTDPHSPFYVGKPEVTAGQVLALNAQQMQGLREGQKNVNQAQVDATDAANKVAVAGAAQDKSAREHYGNQLFESTERDRLAENMFQADRDKLLREKQGVIKEQTDYANAIPTDLWGASGVNKIAGIIGLALGTLGGAATGGKNTALDAMNTLADQNIRRMKMHYDMLGDKVKGYDNTYAMLRQKLGDAHSAELGTRAVMLENFQNQLKIAEDNTVEPRAKAALAQTRAAAAQQSQTLQVEIAKLSDQQVVHAASVAAAVHSTDASHAEHRESMSMAGKGQPMLPGEINGLIAPENPNLRLSKADTDKIRSEQRGVGEVTDVVNHIKKLVASGGLKDQALRSQAEGELTAAIIKARDFSNRVGGNEGALIEKIAGSLSVGIKGWATSTLDQNLVMRQLNALNGAMTRGFVNGLITNGYQIDPAGRYAADLDKDDTADMGGNAIGKYAARDQPSTMTAEQRKTAPIPAYPGND